MAAGALALLLAWALFAFGAVYEWACLPVVIGAPLLCLFKRPAILGPGTRVLDAALLTVAAAALVQLMPLPAGLRDAISPAARDFTSRVSLIADRAIDSAPLSLAPAAWVFGAGATIAAILIFWSARDTAEARGVRFLARSIAWMGLAASVLALVQPAIFPNGRIYGFWEPIWDSAHPIGPIISRNHFASWVLMAVPLSAGYLIAHARSHWIGRSRRKGFAMLSDLRALWLLAAGAFMTAALFITQSRSGLIGLLAATLFWLARGWGRLHGRARAGVLIYILALGALASLWASPDGTLLRFERAWSGTDGGRLLIWGETTRLISRFWVAGVGLGAFDLAMAAYQSSHDVLFNHAHNQYLQLAAEGGALVVAPALVALAAFAALARRRLAEDPTPRAHLREGALAGLVGLAVQSVVETPFVTPAVMFLAAAAAAIVVHPSAPALTGRRRMAEEAA